MINPEKSEYELLFRVVQRVGNKDSVDNRIKEITNKELNQDEVIQYAQSQGLVFPLKRAIKEISPSSSEKLLQELNRIHHKSATRNLQSVKELHRLMNKFQRHNINVIPYKGPVIAEYSYGDISRRSFKDLDFLIFQHNIENVISVLKQQEYELVGFDNGAPSVLIGDSIFRWEREFRFSNKGNKIQIELRPQFMTCGCSSATIISELWDRKTPISVAGKSIPGLSHNDRALLLLAHGTKHTWCRLSWIYDLALLIDQGVDWNEVITRADRYGWKTAAMVGLAVVSELSGIDLPSLVVNEIKKSKRIIISSFLIIVQQWLMYPNKQVDWEPWTEVFSMNDSYEDVLRELLDVIFSPRKGDYSCVTLPKKFHQLYYVIHIYRLLMKNFSKILNKIIRD